MIKLRQNNAFALTFSLIFLTLIIAFTAVYILAVANGVSQANRTANLKKAYYVADAGLVDAYERIRAFGLNTIPASTPGNPFIPNAATDNGVYTLGTTANSPTGNYTVTVAVSGNPRTNYTITSTGTFGNESKTLQLKIIWSSISKYAYWSNTEISPYLGALWWITGMLTVGPVQTNGALNIWGNPIFDGAVTESGNSPNYWDSSSNQNLIFTDGLTNNAPQILLPPATTLNNILQVASDGQGMVLTGPSTVIFNPSGTITVTGQVKTPNGTVTASYNNVTMNPPNNGVIYVQSNQGQQDGNVTVQGTVKGQLTVAADQNVYVSGSVAYNSDPRTSGNANSTDLVALVASQNITIIAASAPASLEMSGVLVALQGSFQVDNYWIGGKGNMDQFGSLVNNYCGPTGVFDPSSGILYGGWNQIQSYDERLKTMAPPGFPPYVDSSGNAVYSKLSITECTPSGNICG